MHNAHYDDMFFTKQYVRGLRDDIRILVAGQMPTTVLKAAALAKVQQQLLDKVKANTKGNNFSPRHSLQIG